MSVGRTASVRGRQLEPGQSQLLELMSLDRAVFVARVPRARRQPWTWLATALYALASAQGVSGQDTGAEHATLPAAGILATSSTGGTGSSAGLDSVVHAALEKLGVVKVVAQPGLDLGAVQLAIDCIGETPACLREVAAQMKVQILVAPALEQSGEELVVTLMYFDTRGEGELRHVVRRQRGHELIPETLDAVPDMLRELFALATSAQRAGQAPATAARSKSGVPVGPLIVAGAGIALIATGVITGLTLKSKQDSYAKLPVTSMGQAQTAYERLSSGNTQALVANVLYGIGAAAVAAGGIWLALELSHRDRKPSASDTALLPWVAKGQLGLVLVRGRGAL